mmetsp:Transcript_15163/g.17437  ORF Transcript_15163/g.17437 Transcript_15163/m.17437 type:complete len:95 (+) Transcript_15163:207-491(+)
MLRSDLFHAATECLSNHHRHKSKGVEPTQLSFLLIREEQGRLAKEQKKLVKFCMEDLSQTTAATTTEVDANTTTATNHSPTTTKVRLSRNPKIC